MRPYLMAAIALSVALVSAYVVTSNHQLASTTGQIVEISDEEVTDTQTSDDLVNEQMQEEDTSSLTQTDTCPATCYDNDRCTSDYCNENTVYRCVNERIVGCCPLGKVYCNGQCSITRCMVEDDCDDGLFYTEDMCDSPNSCDSICLHVLIENICGNFVCESGEDHTNCSKDCSFTTDTESEPSKPEPAKSPSAVIATNRQTFVADENVTIIVFTSYAGDPTPGVTLEVSVRYPSCSDDDSATRCYVRYPSKSNQKVLNYTDESGLFEWVFSTSKTGTFNATVTASGDGYGTVFNSTSFEIV